MSPYSMNTMNGTSIVSSTSSSTKVATTPIFTHYSASPSYVETHTYEDPNQILPLTTMNNKGNNNASNASNTLGRDHFSSTLIHPGMSYNQHHTLLHPNLHMSSNQDRSHQQNQHQLSTNCVSYGASGSFPSSSSNSSSDQHHQVHPSLPIDFSIHDITRTLNSIRQANHGRRTNLWF